MDDMVSYLLKQYGDEELEEAEIDLIKESFWSGIRASLFKKIVKKNIKGCQFQWSYIIGKRTRDYKGNRILLDKRSEKYLWKIVDYLNSTEGLEDLQDLGIQKAPEHIDDLIEIIRSSKNDREIKREQFRLFLKHKHKIMKFLLR